MEQIIEAMNHDAWLNSEKKVSVYQPFRVKVLISEETALVDYEENTEDVFADLAWEFGMDEMRLYV